MQLCGLYSDCIVPKIARALVILLTIQGVRPLINILPFYITSFSTNSLEF